MKKAVLSSIQTKTTKKGLILASVGLLVLLSLFSYSTTDNSFNNIGTTRTHNLLFGFGAYFADLLFQWFGLSVFLAFPFLFFASTKLILKKPISFPKFKTIYTIITMFCFCFILNTIDMYQHFFPLPIGGNIGVATTKLTPFLPQKVITFIVCFLVVCLHPYCVFVFGEGKKHQQTKLKNKPLLFKIVFAVIKKTSHFAKTLFFVVFHPLTSIKTIFKTKKQNKKIQTQVKIKKPTQQTQTTTYIAPVSSLLKVIEKQNQTQNQVLCKENMTKLAQTLGEFGVRGSMIGYKPGPIVTLYEFKPQAGVKASRVINLAEDIARTMMVTSVRTSTLSGRDTLGIEVPNKSREVVCFRRLIESQEYENTGAKIPMILGCNIFGRPIVADLTEMPHLLIAGTTGSGKSVGINGMILSMLYKLSPQECKLIMIDPKMLEFSAYDGIPHLLLPVITNAKQAVLALKWVVAEMEKRYKTLSDAGVRNIVGFNEKVEQKKIEDEKLPYLVVVIDEMADLMVVAKKEIEVLVQRIAQMARAAGIHLITATQRPSVDVITGVIKANFPTRISYHVTSKIDSRTILGEQGAEQLLGKGDLLFMLSGVKSLRVHGPLITDEEVENVVNYIKKNNQPPEYITLTNEDENEDFGSGFSGSFGGGFENETDNSLYKQAVRIVLTEKKTSISYLQRKLRIGYNKSANFIEKMEQEGILSSPDLTGRRTILNNPEDY